MITLKNLTKEKSNGSQGQALRLAISNKIQERELNLNISSDGTSNDVTCCIKNKRKHNGAIESEEIEMQPIDVDVENLSLRESKSITRTVMTIFIDNNEVGRVIIIEDSDLDTDRSL